MCLDTLVLGFICLPVHTHTHTHRHTDANRFYNLSHAICYSYGTDKNRPRQKWASVSGSMAICRQGKIWVNVFIVHFHFKIQNSVFLMKQIEKPGKKFVAEQSNISNKLPLCLGLCQVLVITRKIKLELTFELQYSKIKNWVLVKTMLIFMHIYNRANMPGVNLSSYYLAWQRFLKHFCLYFYPFQAAVVLQTWMTN